MPPKTRTTTKPPVRRATRSLAAKTPAPGVLQLDRQENVDLLAEREPLFSIDGIVYSIPKHVPASVTIKATELALTDGEAVGLEYAMTTMLGEDGYAALKSCKTLTAADLNFVVHTIADKVIPPKEAS